MGVTRFHPFPATVRSGRAAWGLLLALVCGALAVAASGPPPVVLTQPSPPVELARALVILRDPSAHRNIQEILAAPASDWVAPGLRGTPAFGFSPDVFWVRFGLRSAVTNALVAIVELKATRFEKLDWFLVEGGAVVATEAAGNLRPRAGLKLPTRLPAIPVNLPPGETVEVFLRAETETSILFPLTVYCGYESFARAAVKRELGRFVFAGLILGIFALSLVLAITLRQFLFLLNVLLAAILLLAYVVFSGYWTWFELPYATYLVRQPSLALVVAWCLVAGFFTREFFSDSLPPAWLRHTGEGLLLGLVPLLVLMLFLPYRLCADLAALVNVGTMGACLLITAWQYFFRKKQNAWLMLLAWVLNLAIMVVLHLQWHGWMPTWLPTQLGMLEFVAVLTFLFLVASMNRSFQRLQSQVRTQTLERALLEARLRMLRYQVNPHFLFNSLNSAISLTLESPARTHAFLTRLSRFLRASLQDSTDMTVLLAEEVQTVQAYLNVEQVRFEQRLEVTFDIPDEAGNYLVPELVLQPLVENAIKHGMRRAPFVLRLRIHAARDGDDLQLEVANTGRLKTPAPATPAEPSTDGIGLPNLRQRLELIYRGRARLTLAEADGWVLARIRLPLAQSATKSAHAPACD